MNKFKVGDKVYIKRLSDKKFNEMVIDSKSINFIDFNNKYHVSEIHDGYTMIYYYLENIGIWLTEEFLQKTMTINKLRLVKSIIKSY